jgi:hypothetical protein
MDFEKALEQVAKRYAEEGFSVSLHPQGEQLPAFAKDFGVDILATRGEERVLVQVKWDREDLEADPSVPAQAGVTNTQPGWRYDLVVLNEGDPFRRVTRGATEPTREQIEEMLQNVDRLMQAGYLQAACVFAWAALEAAMRQVANDAGLYLPRITASEMLRTLYANGFLTREAFEELKQSFRVRTEVVHGLVPSAVDVAMVSAAAQAARQFLSGNRGPHSAAG